MPFGDILRKKRPAEQRAEIAAKIAAAESERQQLLSARPGAVVARMQGDSDAGSRVEFINQEVAALDARLLELREADAELARNIATSEAAQRQREIEARPKNVAELRGQYLAAARQADEHADGLALAIRARDRIANQLADELASEGARRFLFFGAWVRRFQSGIARKFAIDPAKGLTPDNNLLGIRSTEVGARANMSVLDHEREGLDDLAPFFDDQAEAEAAKERLAARNTATVIVPLAGGVWTLVRAENAFGDRATADKAAARSAATARPKAILAHQGGFVLVDARFASDAA